MTTRHRAGPDSRESQFRAVEQLARRVLGPLAGSVRVSGLADPAPGRAYEYRARGGRLTIAATDGVSASVGLHAYLRAACGRSVGWDTPLPLDIPALPDRDAVRATARVAEGYYFNFCTFSYTTAYWGWDDWEREIDWMALHGITMPLAAVGHEATLLLAYTRLGLAEEEVLRFLGGPGYLPFQYMGCLDGFAGPMPRGWIDRHRELGQRIIRREEELGMTPVLPAFAGNVPRELAPSSVTTREWMGFDTYVLDPADPLYREVGRRVVEAQRDLFGAGHHHYAADPFIEMLPVRPGRDYPGQVAGATVAGLRAADPGAVWTMQAWPFSYHRGYWTDEAVGAFLGGLDDDQVLLLDLWAEADPQWPRLDCFGGKPWIWCALLNFGGRTDMVADPHGLVRSVGAALAAPRPPAGIGLSMEAIHNNAAFFELAVDQIWYDTSDVPRWFDAFAAQRYGSDDPDLPRAWQGLLGTVYDPGGRILEPGIWRSVLTCRPSYLPLADLDALRRGVTGALWYDPAVLADAWRRLLGAAERDPSLQAGSLGHDLVEVAVAAMTRIADRRYLDLVARTAAGGPLDNQVLERFLAVFTDLDRLLATRPELTLAHWESQARSWATSREEQRLLLDNARRILTVWNVPDTDLLDDYAGRIWSGLVGGYYRRRWEEWARGLNRSTLADPHAAERDLTRRLQACAEAFLAHGARVVHRDLGEVVGESRRLFARYGPVLAGVRDSATERERDRAHGRTS